MEDSERAPDVEPMAYQSEQDGEREERVTDLPSPLREDIEADAEGREGADDGSDDADAERAALSRGQAEGSRVNHPSWIAFRGATALCTGAMPMESTQQ